MNEPTTIVNPTPEQLEDAFRDSVDAFGAAAPGDLARDTAERVADSVAAREVQDGTRLVAGDGRRYIVSNLQHRYVPVVNYPRRGTPRTLPSFDELLRVGTKSTLTLQREVPKVRGKAARRQEKRARMQTREQIARQRERINAGAPVNWEQLDAQVRHE